MLIWQSGYDLEGPEAAVRRAEEFLAGIEADTVIRDGTLYAVIFGNMYWLIRREGDRVSLKPLNPMKIGIRQEEKTGLPRSYVYQPEFGRREEYKPEEIIHLRFNAEPWSIFGVSCCPF